MTKLDDFVMDQLHESRRERNALDDKVVEQALEISELKERVNELKKHIAWLETYKNEEAFNAVQTTERKWMDEVSFWKRVAFDQGSKIKAAIDELKRPKRNGIKCTLAILEGGKQDG